MSPFTPPDAVSSPPAGVELNALPPGHVLRSTLRICAGLLAVILGLLACTFALFTAVTPGRLTLVTWLVSIFVLLAGFAGLAVTRVAWAPLRPTRIALAVSVIIAGFMLPMSAYPLRALGMGSVATLMFAESLAVAWIAACWHARWLLIV